MSGNDGYAMMREEHVDVQVWRGTESGSYEHFMVPANARDSVLDVVTYIQRNLDSTLAYRFACRVGMCGSCAMTVNGTPRWTCRTRLARVVRGHSLQLAPLRNLPVIRDLVADMTPFFNKWHRAQGNFKPAESGGSDFAQISPDSKRRKAADLGSECINCGACYAACDVVHANPDYLGPAALNRAWTLLNDERDGARVSRLRAVAGDAGCHACHSQQHCLTHCPMGLNPAAAIAGLKRATTRAALKGIL